MLYYVPKVTTSRFDIAIHNSGQRRRFLLWNYTFDIIVPKDIQNGITKFVVVIIRVSVDKISDAIYRVFYSR